VALINWKNKNKTRDTDIQTATDRQINQRIMPYWRMNKHVKHCGNQAWLNVYGRETTEHKKQNDVNHTHIPRHSPPIKINRLRDGSISRTFWPQSLPYPIPSIAQEVHLGEEITLTAAEVYPTVGVLQAARCHVFQS